MTYIDNIPDGVILESGDLVTIKVKNSTFHLRVHDHYIVDIANYDHSIFRKLEIEDPFAYCRNVYGYEPVDIDTTLPSHNNGDFDAATKLIRSLIELANLRIKKTGVDVNEFTDMILLEVKDSTQDNGEINELLLKNKIRKLFTIFIDEEE